MSEFHLPPPREELFGCMWLPRIRAKAQLIENDALPDPYKRAFCHREGVDGHFLSHFNLERDALLAACHLPDDEFEHWFMGLPDNNEGHIATWNMLAVNLGRPGYPMAERFQWAMGQYYTHLVDQQLETVFTMIEADEALPQ